MKEIPFRVLEQNLLLTKVYTRVVNGFEVSFSKDPESSLEFGAKNIILGYCKLIGMKVILWNLVRHKKKRFHVFDISYRSSSQRTWTV